MVSRSALEALQRGVRVGAEDLERHERAQPELVARGRGRAREACVRERPDPRAEALGRTEAGDRDRVAVEQPRLPLDVEGDPRRERERVAEARVDRVLEVRVRVDERRDDDGLVEAPPLALELGGRPDRHDPVSLATATPPSRTGSPSTGTTQSAS